MDGERVTLESMNAKLDRIIAFMEGLSPFLPLLERAARLLDNPASRFRHATRRNRDGQDH